MYAGGCRLVTQHIIQYRDISIYVAAYEPDYENSFLNLTVFDEKPGYLKYTLIESWKID